MNKKRVLEIISIIIGAIILLLGIMTVITSGLKRYVADGESNKETFDYVEYEDHVTLIKYYGDEQQVVIPDTINDKPVTEIEYECFANKDEKDSRHHYPYNDTTVTVTLGKNIEIIGVRAFAECENLVEMTGGENVKKIDRYAFSDCPKLEIVEVGKQVEVIERGAFDLCGSLKVMESQEYLQYIGNYAFSESGLERFEFNPEAEVGSQVFEGTQWIQNQLEEYVVYGEGSLIGYSGTEEKVIIPEGVKTLVGGCFDGTTAKEIYLPKTVTYLQHFVFDNCNNVRVYIPASVVQMGTIDAEYEVENPILGDNAQIIIITTKGSTAEQYAIDNNIPYEIVEEW